jgi:hypothetical protein
LNAIVEKGNGYTQEITLSGKNFEAGKPYELTGTMKSEEAEGTQNGIVITRENEEMTDNENEYIIEEGEITEVPVTAP